MYVYIYIYILRERERYTYVYIYIYIRIPKATGPDPCGLPLGGHPTRERDPSCIMPVQGFQGYGLSSLRIRYLVPRIYLFVSCLAILRIEGVLSDSVIGIPYQ